MEAKKAAKKSIPQVLRDQVWETYASKDKFSSYCLVCKKELHYTNFHCGHVEAEANGGGTNLENLRPICARCNLSMGTTNMFEFMKTINSPQVPKIDSAIEPVPPQSMYYRLFYPRIAPIEWYEAMLFFHKNRQYEALFPLNIRLYLRLADKDFALFIDRRLQHCYELTGEADIAFYQLAKK